MIQRLSAQALPLNNAGLAASLNEIAELLDAQEANPYRVRAYRNAARSIAMLDRQVHEILRSQGSVALAALPGIGKSLVRSLECLTRTGRLPLLEELRGSASSEERLVTVPGIGRKMAERIHSVLGIESLTDLEAAAYDGRLAAVPGFGSKRLRAVRESLAGRFRRPRLTFAPPAPLSSPPAPIAELLSIDEEYREKAEKDRLLRVAPRRFNPGAKAWLPVLRTERAHGHYTALYSNTARAHDLGTVHDWVIVHRDAAHGGGQWTVITSLFGELRGRRIVSGREAECADYYSAARPVQKSLPLAPEPTN